jgi:hypothetical protein
MQGQVSQEWILSEYDGAILEKEFLCEDTVIDPRSIGGWRLTSLNSPN